MNPTDNNNNNTFDDRVYQMVAAQGGNARLPSPIQLCYSGEPTREAEALGVTDWEAATVYRAYKRLVVDGRLRFVRRYGYVWLVPSHHNTAPEEAITDTEVDMHIGPIRDGDSGCTSWERL